MCGWLLRDARQRVVDSDRRFSGWFSTALVQRWHARLNCALVSGLWEAAAALWGFTGARVGLWDDLADVAGTSECLSGLAEVFMRPWDGPCPIVSKKKKLDAYNFSDSYSPLSSLLPPP